MDEVRPEWDDKLAERLEGSVILVGITYEDPSGPRLDQFFGTVVGVDPDNGIELRLGGSRSGETFVLPPDLRSLNPAERGSYRLGQTGEVVIDPDFTTTWNVAPPRN